MDAAPEPEATRPTRAEAAAEGAPAPAQSAVSAPADGVIDAVGLGRDFALRDGTAVTAVQALDLTVRAGEVVGLLGHNGAGKTTTLRLLTGVLRPTRGSVRVLGLDPGDEGARLRERVGVLTETAAVDPRLTGRENLEAYGQLYGLVPAEAASRSRDVLERFGLETRADDRTAGYSKGMRRRLALARALLHEPDLLLLDEPTADLDPLARRDVHALIRELAGRRRTILLCTHDLAEAQELCDRVVVLRRGAVIAQGTPAELSARWGHRLTLRLDLGDADRPAARDALGPEHAAVDVPGGLEVQDVPRDAIPEITARLVRRGVALFAVAPQPPTLEDAYVALHGGERGGSIDPAPRDEDRGAPGEGTP